MADIRPKAEEDKEGEPASDRPWRRLHTSARSPSPPPLSPPAKGRANPTATAATTTAITGSPFNGPQPKRDRGRASPLGEVASKASKLSHSTLSWDGKVRRQDACGAPEDSPRSGSSVPKKTEKVARRVSLKNSTRVTQPQPHGVRSGKAKVTEETKVTEEAKAKPHIQSIEASASEATSDSDDSNVELPRLELPRTRTMHNPPASVGAGASGAQNQNQRGGRGATTVNSNEELWDFGTESSESSSEDCDEDATWEPQSEFMHFLMTSPKRSDSSEPPPTISQSRRKRKLNSTSATAPLEDETREDDSSFAPVAKQSLTHDCSDTDSSKNDNVLAGKERKVRRKPNNAKSPSVVPQALDSGDAALDTKEHFIESNFYKNSNDDDHAESAKPNHAITNTAERLSSDADSAPAAADPAEPLFFPCVRCNVNFKEKAHLHRHMLQHQAPPNPSLPRPFICRECGRSFRADGALQRHMVIHQARRERLMEEIKGLSEMQDEGRGARLQCPQCVFGTDCAKTFVQHAKTHEKDKRYYCCDGCSLMATSPQELKAHRCPAHPENHTHKTHSSRQVNHTHNTGSTQQTNHVRQRVPQASQPLSQDREKQPPMEQKEVLGMGTLTRITLLHCKICPFSTLNSKILKKHIELIHRQPYFDKNDDDDDDDDEDEDEEEEEDEEEYEDEAEEEVGLKAVSKVSDLSKPRLDLRRLSSSSPAKAKAGHTGLSQLRPKLNSETPLALRKGEVSPAFWSARGFTDLCMRNNKAPPKKERQGLGLPVFKWSFGSSTNKLSAALPRLDKPSKLSPPPPPPPTARIDVTTGHLHEEGEEREEEEEEGGHQKCAEPVMARKVTVAGPGLMPGDREKTKHISATDASSNATATDRTSAGAKEIQENHKSDCSDIPIPSGGKGVSAQSATPHRTVSKRKMSIPFHNKSKPKPEPVSPLLTEEEDDFDFDDDDEDDDNDDEDTSLDFRDYTATFLDHSERRLNSFVSSKPLYLHRSRLPPRKDVLRSNGSEEEEDSDCDDVNDLVIKEECEETSVSLDVPSPRGSGRGSFAESQGPPTFSSDMKTCPYCPAVFESGVGLSNHVRGHLHRVGLSYDARHMVSPEQVASQDRQPRIRRKAPSAIQRRIKKASVDKPESQTEHTCPLCWGWFDTRTGLSNHVRGHLKRIGHGLGSPRRSGVPVAPSGVPSGSPTSPNAPGAVSNNSRSPLCILNELLRDETEHRSILALLGRRPGHTRPLVSQKFATRDGLFLTPSSVPAKVLNSKGRSSGTSRATVVGAGTGTGTAVTGVVSGSSGGNHSKSKPWAREEMVEAMRKEKKEEEEEELEIRVGGHHGGRGGGHRVVERAAAIGHGATVAPSSTLVDLLRRRKQERDMLMREQQKHHVHSARRQVQSSPARESVGRLAALKPDPGWSQGKADVKKVCMHCNATFHSAVSLSNHLRAYARRKRAALVDGTTYECKQKKPRSRAGPKKKTFSLPHTPEEIYRLTCRFCDLVFQGPLSVQEDWIKHLQRHLMHTSVPRSGAAMVEVTAVCKELPPPPPPERLPLPPSQHNTHLQLAPTVS